MRTVWWLLLWIIPLIAAWSPEDREIFRLKEQIENDLGTDVTFYDWLNVDRRAPEVEITKAYRKLSRKLHPDKNPSKEAGQRFARLGVVANILRDVNKRERYDFFLEKGFPKWKDNDYFYTRYRPGLVTVILFLYLFGGVFQFYLMRLSASRNRLRVQNIIDDARQGCGWPFTSTQKRILTSPNGRTFAVYPDGNVFIVDEKKIEFHIQPEDIKDPKWTDTILIKIPQWVIRKLTGKVIFSEGNGPVSGNDSNAIRKTKKPAPVEKVGGIRKKR